MIFDSGTAPNTLLSMELLKLSPITKIEFSGTEYGLPETPYSNVEFVNI
jgi:hypothetical protein